MENVGMGHVGMWIDLKPNISLVLLYNEIKTINKNNNRIYDLDKRIDSRLSLRYFQTIEYQGLTRIEYTHM